MNVANFFREIPEYTQFFTPLKGFQNFTQRKIIHQSNISFFTILKTRDTASRKLFRNIYNDSVVPKMYLELINVDFKYLCNLFPARKIIDICTICVELWTNIKIFTWIIKQNTLLFLFSDS